MQSSRYIWYNTNVRIQVLTYLDDSGELQGVEAGVQWFRERDESWVTQKVESASTEREAITLLLEGRNGSLPPSYGDEMNAMDRLYEAFRGVNVDEWRNAHQNTWPPPDRGALKKSFRVSKPQRAIQIHSRELPYARTKPMLPTRYVIPDDVE